MKLADSVVLLKAETTVCITKRSPTLHNVTITLTNALPRKRCQGNSSTRRANSRQSVECCGNRSESVTLFPARYLRAASSHLHFFKTPTQNVKFMVNFSKQENGRSLPCTFHLPHKTATKNKSATKFSRKQHPSTFSCQLSKIWSQHESTLRTPFSTLTWHEHTNTPLPLPERTRVHNNMTKADQLPN